MTRRFCWVGLLAGIWLGLVVAADAQDVPKFTQFTEKIYAGPNASVKLVTKDDKEFGTRLREGGRQPVNFAGHHILTTWGCGAECVGGAVAWLPYSVCCWGEGEPFYFRKDSRLIVFSGVLDEESPRGAHFFEFRDGAFRHLTSRAKGRCGAVRHSRA